MDNLGIGKRIKELRKERDLTLDMLAIDMNKMFNLNINKGMISKWENGTNIPTLDYATYLVRYFNISLDYLIGLTDKKIPPHLR